MAGELTVTAAQVAVIDPLKAEIFTGIAGEAITAGLPLYMAATGLLGIADANAAGFFQCRGIALNAAGAGQAVDYIKRGRLAGMGTGAVNCSVPIFVSDTVGRIATSAGSTSVCVGIVVPMSDKDLTRVLYVEARYGPDWA